jgi:hypothetical protein
VRFPAPHFSSHVLPHRTPHPIRGGGAGRFCRTSRTFPAPQVRECGIEVPSSLWSDSADSATIRNTTGPPDCSDEPVAGPRRGSPCRIGGRFTLQGGRPSSATCGHRSVAYRPLESVSALASIGHARDSMRQCNSCARRSGVDKKPSESYALSLSHNLAQLGRRPRTSHHRASRDAASPSRHRQSRA